MKVVLADDHRVLLDALGTALQLRGHEVADLVTTPQAAVEATGRHEPDALLMDFSFPQGTCHEAIRHISASHPATRVVVLSGSEDPVAVGSVLVAGASGFVSKSTSIEAICDALNKAVAGQVAVEHRLLQRALSVRREEGPLYGLRFLTEREWEVLRCITLGQTTKQIAASLDIRHATARTHVQRLLAKLGVHSRLEAAALISQHSADVRWPERVRRPHRV